MKRKKKKTQYCILPYVTLKSPCSKSYQVIFVPKSSRVKVVGDLMPEANWPVFFFKACDQ